MRKRRPAFFLRALCPIGSVDHNDSARSRWMAYDPLDRLTDANAAMFGGDHWHRFTYDALDNLRSWKLAGVKDYAEYVYDASNRLTAIKNTGGSTLHTLSYDVQGNLAAKDAASYTFDFGNRLRLGTGPGGSEGYRYDGHGRRALAWVPAGATLSFYAFNGQLLYQHSTPKARALDHIYLAGSLVAIREVPFAGGSEVKYQHTDALGSPVAISNAAGAVTERTNYDPYGGAINKTVDGVGYTGHVMDPVTGLTYMQQRYYDSAIGRFLSVDPIAARVIGDNFNRYWYANNNPYRFTDPDGRQSHAQCAGSPANAVICREIAAELGGTASGTTGGSGGASKGFWAGVLAWLGITVASESGEEGGDKPQYPTNPDDWEVPDGWTETSAGQNTGGRNRQWKDEEGRIRRRWDREGRENGKERGPHWHDSDDDSGGKKHIEPDDAPEPDPPPADRA